MDKQQLTRVTTALEDLDITNKKDCKAIGIAMADEIILSGRNLIYYQRNITSLLELFSNIDEQLRPHIIEMLSGEETKSCWYDGTQFTLATTQSKDYSDSTAITRIKEKMEVLNMKLKEYQKIADALSPDSVVNNPDGEIRPVQKSEGRQQLRITLAKE